METRLLVQRLDILQQIAQDIADYANKLTVENCKEILQQAFDYYKSPSENGYAYSFGGRLGYKKNRVDIITTYIQELTAANMLPTLYLILEDGGNTESSYNTWLMRCFLKHFSNYDHEVNLILESINRLNILLLVKLNKLMEDQRENLQKQLDIINADISRITNELKEYSHENDGDILLMISEIANDEFELNRMEEIFIEDYENVELRDINEKKEKIKINSTQLKNLNNATSKFTTNLQNQLKNLSQKKAELIAIMEPLDKALGQQESVLEANLQSSGSFSSSDILDFSLFSQTSSDSATLPKVNESTTPEEIDLFEFVLMDPAEAEVKEKTKERIENSPSWFSISPGNYLKSMMQNSPIFTTFYPPDKDGFDEKDEEPESLKEIKRRQRLSGGDQF